MLIVNDEDPMRITYHILAITDFEIDPVMLHTLWRKKRYLHSFETN